MTDETKLEESTSRSFEIGPGGRLTVTSDNGHIRVDAADGHDQLEVKVTCVVEADDAATARKLMDGIKIDFSQHGDHVKLAAKSGLKPRREWHFRWPWRLGPVWDDRPYEDVAIHVEVRCPKRFDLDLKTRAGAMEVSDLFGKVHARAAAGHIKVGNVVGDVKVFTRAGGIRVGRVEGRVEANSLAGPIRVAEVTDGIEAESRAGGVTASLSRQPARGSRLTTLAGNLTVSLADGVGVDMDASTRRGRLHVDLPVTTQGDLGRRIVRGTVNGGGPKLVLRALTGNVHLKRASQSEAR